MNEQEYIAGETCYRPEPSKCYYSPCGKIGKCVKDIPDYDPRKPIETYNGVSLSSVPHPEGDPVPDDHEINPDSLETVEIDIPVMPEDQLETWMHNMIRACNRSTFDSDINVLKLIQHIENLYEKGRRDEREQAEQWDTSDMAHRPGGLSMESWVSLTDEEIDYIWGISPGDYEDKFAFPRAIEAKLREKNT